MSGWTPHVVVAAIVEQDGRYLTVEESIEGTLLLNQPAGHWEAGETLFEAVRRETLEEAAWEVEPVAFLGVYEWRPPTLPYPFVRFSFLCRALRHHPGRALDTGIARALWMTYEELDASRARHRSPAVMQGLNDLRAGRRFPLEVIRHL